MAPQQLGSLAIGPGKSGTFFFFFVGGIFFFFGGGKCVFCFEIGNSKVQGLVDCFLTFVSFVEVGGSFYTLVKRGLKASILSFGVAFIWKFGQSSPLES